MLKNLFDYENNRSVLINQNPREGLWMGSVRKMLKAYRGYIQSYC